MSECCDAGALLVCGVVMGAMVCEKIGECIELKKCSFEFVSVVCVGDCKWCVDGVSYWKMSMHCGRRVGVIVSVLVECENGKWVS